MSQLLEMLGCRYPIIQGPIGAMNSPALVAAISEAGAYGMLALGFIRDIDEAKRILDGVRELTDRPFGANLMIINPLNEQLVPVLARAGVKTVTTSVGSPEKIYPLIHDYGMKGLHVLLALQHAIKAERSGADGIVVAGSEAGGLRSTSPESSTMVLVPLVADHVNIPLVAAGGIADSRGYRAALALGAQGVQIGTRFLAAEESPACDAWKRAIVEAGDGGTALVPIGNMSMRAIINPKLKRELGDPSTDFTKIYSFKDTSEAWNSGNFDLVPAGAGESAALIREVLPVRAIIEEMVR